MPSITGRRRKGYEPMRTPLTENVNVAVWPGATDASDCAAGRFDHSQPSAMPSWVSDESSFTTPIRASVPLPLTQVAVPRFRIVTETCALAPKVIVGYALCATHAEW